MSRVLSGLKYLRIGNRSFECGKILSVRMRKSWFGKPEIIIKYDADQGPYDCVLTGPEEQYDRVFQLIQDIIASQDQLVNDIVNEHEAEKTRE